MQEKWGKVKVLRAIASFFVFLILAFFLIGVAASNDWEDGAGTLAKVVIIPICLLLGLLLFKLAAPIFGVTPTTRPNPGAEARAREKTLNNRYRMGNDLPTSYALAVFGLILLLAAISREDQVLGVVSLVVLVSAFIMRGRLQSERNFAKSIGARTFENDVVDTIDGAVTLADEAAKFVFDKSVSSFKKFVAEENHNSPSGITSENRESLKLAGLEPTGAFKYQLFLNETNYLNGDWGPTDWLYCIATGNSKTKVYEKIQNHFSDEVLLEKYLLAAKECRLLIQLVFDFQSSRFASVIKKIEAVKEDNDYKNMETYVLWFYRKSIGRSDLTISEEITATSRPDLHQALLLLDQKDIEIVSVILNFVTDFILKAENS